jgi:hypothetical protein
MWDMADLDAPVYLGYYESSSPASDHNLYTKGDYCYQSNYRAGLRILDMTDLENGNLDEVAFFDLFPQSDDVNTGGGTWSNYPYFESGNIIITHRQFGLFVLRPKDNALIESVDEDFSHICAEDSVPSSISESVNQLFTVFPNPSAGEFTLMSEDDVNAGQLRIVDVVGREVFRSTQQYFANSPIRIDLSGEPSGTYFISVQGESISTQRLVIN